MARSIAPPDRPTSLRTGCTSLRRVWTGLLVFYAVALALNATALHRNNERLPFGPVRTLWTSLSAPVARATEALGLDQPRAWLRRRLGAPLNAP